ncbi:MAG: DUF983 domain-containing protein [Saprospiraceae bacterium]|nr:DUF983 domain-containing protein [Saprospiraceae bacterium]
MAKFLEKGSKSYSIMYYKCPRCQEGDLYPTKMWSFKKSFHMLSNCPACGMKYEIETGFFWGSMYVSYALSSAWLLGSFAVCFFLMDFSVRTSLSVAFLGIIPLYVWVFRTARAIWLNIFVTYAQK